MVKMQPAEQGSPCIVSMQQEQGCLVLFNLLARSPLLFLRLPIPAQVTQCGFRGL